MKKKPDLTGPQETPEMLAAVESAPQVRVDAVRLVAKVFFVCACLDRSFNPGDEVVGWDGERIARYINVLVEYRA